MKNDLRRLDGEFEFIGRVEVAQYQDSVRLVEEEGFGIPLIPPELLPIK